MVQIRSNIDPASIRPGGTRAVLESGNLLPLEDLIADLDTDPRLKTESQARPISVNRRAIQQIFLDSGMDYLLQIDSDMAPPNDLLRMADKKKDICSANIKTIKGESIVSLALKHVGDREYIQIGGSGLYEVDAVGTGCLLTSRSVMRDIQIPHVTDTVRAIDFEFCFLAKEHGYSVWFDTRYRCFQYTVCPI